MATNLEQATLRDVRGAHAPQPWGRWLSWSIAVLVGIKIVWVLAENPNFQWQVVGHYLDEASILRGLGVTLALTAISMVLGTV